MGYEIVYKEGVNNTTSIKRIAPGFSSFSSKACTAIKLQYNEHLTNIDLIYNQDEIKYIEITTSKGNSLKVGTQIENGYTSLNKVDTTQKNYAPIVAFESTFSKDSLKELFIYRCPVRITKRKKKQELTVMEVNHLKAAPNLQRFSRAQENLSLITNFAKSEITSKKVIRTWQAFVQRQKQQSSTNASSTLDTPSVRLENLVSPKKSKDSKESQEALMEEQEYGVDDEDEEEEEKEDQKEKEKKLAAKRKSRISIRIFNPFGLRKGSNSPSNSQDKNGGSKEESFESQIKKIAQTFFGKKSEDNSPPIRKKEGETSPPLNQDKKDDEIVLSSLIKDEMQKQETLKERIMTTEEDRGSGKWKHF